MQLPLNPGFGAQDAPKLLVDEKQLIWTSNATRSHHRHHPFGILFANNPTLVVDERASSRRDAETSVRDYLRVVHVEVNVGIDILVNSNTNALQQALAEFLYWGLRSASTTLDGARGVLLGGQCCHALNLQVATRRVRFGLVPTSEWEALYICHANVCWGELNCTVVLMVGPQSTAVLTKMLERRLACEEATIQIGIEVSRRMKQFCPDHSESSIMVFYFYAKQLTSL